jgi:hypothetical protein
MLFEIRNYYVKPDLLEAYKAWGRSEAIPYLSQQLDVVGFWFITKDAPPEIHGEPQDELGPATVTWIIRWNDVAHRNDLMRRLLSSAAWTDIVSRRPGGSATYLRTESRYAESLS